MFGRLRLVRTLFTLAPTAARTIKLVTFNIHGWRDAEHTDNFDRLVELLQQLKPDVLCLNEIMHPFAAPAADDPYWQAVRDRHAHGYPPPAGSRPDDEAESNLCRLADALDLPHWTFGAAVATEPEPQPFRKSFFGQYPFGNGILSRFELGDIRHTLLKVTPVDLSLGGQARTPDDLEDRQMTTAVVQLPGGGCLGVCSTHLDHKSELLRERQIGRVVAHCAAAFNDKLPHVVCGDLNSYDRNDMTAEQWESITALYAKRGWGDAPPDSKVQRVLRDAGYTDAFAIAPSSSVGGETPPRTCWTNTRLDYVMCQGDVGVLRFETIESDASDHLPVVVELEVPD